MSEIRKRNIPVKKKTSLVHSNHKNNNKSLHVDEYRKLADESLQGILIIQKERIIYVNDAFAKIIGFSTEELLSFNEEQIVNLIH